MLKYLSVFLFLWLWTWGAIAESKTPIDLPSTMPVKLDKLSIYLLPVIGFSSDEKVSTGAGFGLEASYQFTLRVALGMTGQWSFHPSKDFPDQFWRLGVGVKVWFDLLPILPYLQSSIGVQMRERGSATFFSPDLQIGFGLEWPIYKNILLGVGVLQFITLNVSKFPLSRCLHLRLGLVF